MQEILQVMGKGGHFLYMLMDLNSTFPPALQEALWHENLSQTACLADSSDFKDSSGMKRCKLQCLTYHKKQCKCRNRLVGWGHNDKAGPGQ